MLGQAIPFGINVNSPLTLFVIVVALIVVLLTLSTRRANTRPAPSFIPPPQPKQLAAQPDPHAGAWAAAQALFLDDPRAGCAWAEALVASVLRAVDFAPEGAQLATQRFGAASAVLARSDASTDDLRRAFVAFRALYDELSVPAEPEPPPAA